MSKWLTNVKKRVYAALGLCIKQEGPWPNEALQGGNLTYSIVTASVPSGLSSIVECRFAQVFGLWKASGNLPFNCVPSTDGDPRIVIEWVSFGGGGSDGGIAQAQYPPALATDIPRKIQFNAELTWKDGADQDEYDLFTIALHEVGHALGLGHCELSDPIMCDCLGPGTRGALLTAEDEAAIRLLYKTQPIIKKIIAKLFMIFEARHSERAVQVICLDRSRKRSRITETAREIEL